MLASITPLGERGRGSIWGVTVTAFALGATAAGVATGALAGALGALVLPAGVSAHARLAALLAALGAALALDIAPRRVPGPRRQVNERWLDEYRGWVYGVGYGTQLGVGLTTAVSSAATYAALAAAFLAGPLPGALIFGCFGAARGLTPLAAARVRTTRELMAVHRALARWRGRARWSASLVLAGVGAATLLGAIA